MESNSFQSEHIEQEEFSIAEIFFHYLRYWKFFILSVLICLGAAVVYLLYTTPEYKVSSIVLINDDKKGQTMDVVAAFNDLGIVGPKSNLDNEMQILSSKTLMKSVADSLRINVSYFKKGVIKKKEIYKKTPVFVSIPNVIAPGSFIVDSDKEKNLSIRSSDNTDFDQKVETGKEINTPWGILIITSNPFGSESFPIEVIIKKEASPVINIASTNKMSSVMELSLVTPTPKKGEDIINTLIAQYNKNAVDDKNYVAHSTITFIDDRLRSVSGELQSAEQKVEDYQKSRGITDLQAQGQILLSSSSEYNKKIIDAGIQLELLKNIQAYVRDAANKDNTIPSNVGISDPTVLSLINRYNDQVLTKKAATESMSDSHPAFIEYNNRVALIRDDLLRGIGISEASIRATIKELQRQDNMFSGKARDLTTQGRESRDLFRQQSLKETLFNYLLQKREEIELSLVMATPNARVIDPPSPSPAPVKPKKMIILLAALIVGIIIPIGAIYVVDLFDNKIHTKEDILRAIKAPFLGIIPVMKKEEPFPVLKVRSSMAERFRAVISNLEFIVGGEKKKIIAVTSFTSGDGKSFFSRNLAMSYATLGKKTLLIDLDMRKSVLIKTLGLTTEKGSALFLSDPNVKITDIVDKSHTYHKNLDIIPVRLFPPNPAELLSSERLGQLFHGIEKDYDYIIVDTAPIGLVADVYNINVYTQATVFLLRSDYSLKKNLPEIQELYNEKKLNNISVVLNAVSDENIYGYGNYGSYKHNYYTDEN